MSKSLTRRSFLTGTALLAAAGTLGLSGCGGSSSSSDAVKVGSMPTEDILPLWVAEKEGLFDKNGVKVEITLFDSAQNLSAALTAKEVDLAMTDPMRTVKLCESGTDLVMEWITLGTTARQGRFGVLVEKAHPCDDMKELARIAEKTSGAVGVASNTVPEYVFDMLCKEAGVEGKIPTTEIASLPDRYSMVANGKVLGAALPASLLALGEASGMKVAADDTEGDNISQSVMVCRKEFDTDANSQALAALRQSWNDAADKVNADPEGYRSLLVEKANLNDKVAKTYPISAYPHATDDTGKSAYPPAKLIDPQVAWMAQKGYSTKTVTYDEATGSFAIA